MPDFEEVFEDLGENTKKVFKDKRFWFIALGVAAVALWVGYRNGGNATESEAGPYEAIGYAGYPSMMGSGEDTGYSSDTSYLESMISENNSYYESLISENNSIYESELDAMNSNISSLSDKLLSAEDAIGQQAKEMERQQAISQMKANSELYNVLSKPEDAATREALHQANLEIAEQFGWEFDPTSGNYFDGSNVVYTTSNQEAAKVRKEAVAGTVSYSSNAQVQESNNSKIVRANADGNAPKGTNVGDTVVTKGGTYKVVAEGTEGASYNKESGLWSVKVSDKTS